MKKLTKQEELQFWKGYQMALFLIKTSGIKDIESLVKQIEYMEKDSDKHIEKIK